MSAQQDEGGQPTFSAWKFDPAKVRLALIKMFIECELAFSFLEQEAFRYLHYVRIHKGDAMASVIEDCLAEWGIENVMSFTLDNASSNDVAIRELSTWLPGLIRKGRYLHVRCIAHIINLIVQDGLKAENSNIEAIRSAVKFVRNHPNRLLLFKSCAQEKGIKSKALLSLDVPTRWNSTYKMLERVFIYLRQKTIEVSCSTHVVAHEHYSQVKDISHNLDKLSKTCTPLDTPSLKSTLKLMNEKFAKYFEDTVKTNQIFEFAVILDPTIKLGTIEYACLEEIDKMKILKKEQDGMIMTKEEEEKILEEMLGEVKAEMQVVVNEYENLYQMGTTTTTVRKESVPIRSGKNAWMSNYKSRRQGAQTFGEMSELEKYLKDEVEEETEDFDILKWWKYNESRYPTLAKMAKDILAIPISSVASESAFSTGGRVIEPCRSSLSPQIVEALICSQDWIRRERKEKQESNENPDELDKYDDIDKDVNEKIEAMKLE
ncbi:hypothetical protein SSX86_016566 [Deinandra increscens subsp. villosa]|uniref:Transposase n=1 Tax=Deinandra increscens subsp. villosa TaxID=3103831 RepID=A0AAP0D5P9_9ASTR